MEVKLGDDLRSLTIRVSPDDKERVELVYSHVNLSAPVIMHFRIARESLVIGLADHVLRPVNSSVRDFVRALNFGEVLLQDMTPLNDHISTRLLHESVDLIGDFRIRSTDVTVNKSFTVSITVHIVGREEQRSPYWTPNSFQVEAEQITALAGLLLTWQVPTFKQLTAHEALVQARYSQ